MNLILIAPPAAGKGTISSLLKEKYGYICISAGELLRGVDPETELGKKIREIQARGELVDDSITNALMKERLSKDDVKNGFILDGYPRRMEQVEATKEICEELNLNIDYAIYLNVSFETALKRTIGRRICPECKETYNVLTGFKVPKNENTCDYCNVQLTSRNDDNEESLKVRFDLFNQNTLPVVDYYRDLNKLIELDADKDALETLSELENILGRNK